MYRESTLADVKFFKIIGPSPKFRHIPSFSKAVNTYHSGGGYPFCPFLDVACVIDPDYGIYPWYQIRVD
jgi:hypothetical protein